MAALGNGPRHPGAAAPFQGEDEVRPVFFQKPNGVTREHRACWGHVLEGVYSSRGREEKGELDRETPQR